MCAAENVIVQKTGFMRACVTDKYAWCYSYCCVVRVRQSIALCICIRALVIATCEDALSACYALTRDGLVYPLACPSMLSPHKD